MENQYFVDLKHLLKSAIAGITFNLYSGTAQCYQESFNSSTIYDSSECSSYLDFNKMKEPNKTKQSNDENNIKSNFSEYCFNHPCILGIGNNSLYITRSESEIMIFR